MSRFSAFYDAAGNRETTITGSTTDDTEQTNTSTTTTGNELTSDGTFVYEYDADGNLIYQARISQAYSADDQTFYYYNNLNELVDVCTEDNGDTITQEVTCGYNAAGQRMSESVTVGQTTTTTYFVYDLSGNAVLTFDGSEAGDLTGQYVYGQAVDQLLAQTDSSGNVSWMITDRDESVRDVLQSGGGTTSVLDHIDYNSFGETITETASSTPHLTGYAGYVNDLAIGMLETDSRVYDASIGRFISQDPSGFAGSANGNLYEYTSNSPLSNVDPSGLMQQSPLAQVLSSMPVTVASTPIDFGDDSDDDDDDSGVSLQTQWLLQNVGAMAAAGQAIGPVSTGGDDDDDIGPTSTTASGVGAMVAATGNPLADQDPNDPYGAATLGNININTGLSPDDPNYTPVAVPSAADLASIMGSGMSNTLSGIDTILTDESQVIDPTWLSNMTVSTDTSQIPTVPVSSLPNGISSILSPGDFELPVLSPLTPFTTWDMISASASGAVEAFTSGQVLASGVGTASGLADSWLDYAENSANLLLGQLGIPINLPNVSGYTSSLYAGNPQLLNAFYGGNQIGQVTFGVQQAGAVVYGAYGLLQNGPAILNGATNAAGNLLQSLGTYALPGGGTISISTQVATAGAASLSAAGQATGSLALGIGGLTSLFSTGQGGTGQGSPISSLPANIAGQSGDEMLATIRDTLDAQAAYVRQGGGQFQWFEKAGSSGETVFYGLGPTGPGGSPNVVVVNNTGQVFVSTVRDALAGTAADGGIVVNWQGGNLTQVK